MTRTLREHVISGNWDRTIVTPMPSVDKTVGILFWICVNCLKREKQFESEYFIFRTILLFMASRESFEMCARLSVLLQSKKHLNQWAFFTLCQKDRMHRVWNEKDESKLVRHEMPIYGDFPTLVFKHLEDNRRASYRANLRNSYFEISNKGSHPQEIIVVWRRKTMTTAVGWDWERGKAQYVCPDRWMPIKAHAYSEYIVENLFDHQSTLKTWLWFQITNYQQNYLLHSLTSNFHTVPLNCTTIFQCSHLSVFDISVPINVTW